jgi:hypothetical protein
MWGVLGLKIPQRAVGTVPNVLLDAARKLQEGHRGKEGRRTLVTDNLLSGLSSYRAFTLAPLFVHYRPIDPLELVPPPRGVAALAYIRIPWTDGLRCHLALPVPTPAVSSI